MNKKIIAGSTILGLALAGGMSTFLSAQTVAAEAGLSEEQVIEIALAEVPGEVQEVELEKEDGLLIYEVEILTADGVENEVEIDAKTGDVLKAEVEDEDDEDDEDDDHDDHDKDDDDHEDDRDDA